MTGQPDHVSDLQQPLHVRMGLPGEVSVCQLVTGLTIGVALVDFALVGFPDTAVPFNYYAFVSVMHVIVAGYVLQASHRIGVTFAEELATVADRDPDRITAIETDIDGATITEEMDGLLRQAYRPALLVGGAIAFTMLGLLVAEWLGLRELFRYWLIGALFLAAHGMFLAPAILGYRILTRITNRYIIDIDVLAPDGVGGYREIGDGLVTLVSYGIVLLTLDFLVISSVSFIGRPTIQQGIAGAYLLWLVGILLYMSYGIVAIRQRLLLIREQKIELLRTQFKGIEAAYWQKHETDDPRQQEALDMLTMQRMFAELNSMSLWPIDLLSLAKLAASTGVSVVLFAVRQGLFPTPIPVS